MQTLAQLAAFIEVIGVLVVLAAPAAAMQVPNDTCATAMPIHEGVVTGDTTLAGNELPVNFCGFEDPFLHDVWYRFDAVEKGWLKATFGCEGSNFDPGLFTFRNGCDAPEWNCNDDFCGFNSQIREMVTPSQPLLIAVAGLNGSGPFGQFKLKVTVDRLSQLVIAAITVGQDWGGFTGPLSSFDDFGEVAGLGDFDGDGVPDVAVGAPGDDGAIWLLRLSVDGTVLAQQELDASSGFGSVLVWGDAFGTSLAGLGDLDGDGTLDVAVGAPRDHEGGPGTGSVYSVFLDSDMSLKSFTKISPLAGGFGGTIDPEDRFGSGLATLGDVDGDGVVDLAVGAECDDDGAVDAGAVWILFLEPDGSVKSWQKLSATSGGFPGPIGFGDNFGAGVGAPGDIDGDGIPDLIAGAPRAGPGDEGAFWTVLLEADGTVKSAQQIGDSLGGFDAPLLPGDQFGASLCGMGDVNGDSVPDLAVGAPGADDDAVFQIRLNADGSVQQQLLLTEPSGASFFSSQFFSPQSLAFPGDVDGDGSADLLVGKPSGNRFWTMFLDPDNPWTILNDGAIEGTSTFAPELRGEGTLQPGAPWELELAIARRLSPAALVAGASAAFLPFKGGVMVPAPTLVLSGFQTDVQGRLVLQGSWPAGVPAQSQIWIQGFVVDSGAPQGLSASNAVMATTP